MAGSVEMVMTTGFTATPAEHSLRDAARELTLSTHSDLYVTDPTGLLIGIVTDYDLVKHALNGGSWDVPVERLMTSPGVTFTPDQPLLEVAAIFRQQSLARAPVVREQRPIGSICRRSLVCSLISDVLSASVAAEPAAEEFTRIVPPPHYLSRLTPTRPDTQSETQR
ncbi:MAG: cyclic nucleotide-binding/CBS domain-containing protein [Maioricimonas sp. JB045]|uniref:CBS domain-containing protein n=1 Tax=Maioricimonas sp. JC845 TaxID=3232138 RepID=UPI00345A18BB